MSEINKVIAAYSEFTPNPNNPAERASFLTFDGSPWSTDKDGISKRQNRKMYPSPNWPATQWHGGSLQDLRGELCGGGTPRANI